MSKESYDKIMSYLDQIEIALNNVASKTGYCDFNTFVENGCKNDGWEEY